MGSLQNSTSSIQALKALFESKAAVQNKVKSSYKAADMSATNGDAEETKSAKVEPKTQISADASVVKSHTKEDRVMQKVNISTYKDSLVSCCESLLFFSD